MIEQDTSPAGRLRGERTTLLCHVWAQRLHRCQQLHILANCQWPFRRIVKVAEVNGILLSVATISYQDLRSLRQFVGKCHFPFFDSHYVLLIRRRPLQAQPSI